MTQESLLHAPEITLTPTDRTILLSYQTFLDGLAEYMGEGYEFVLHSLEDLDHSVVKIINGSMTGRSVGAPITDLALSMLDKIQSSSERASLSYFTKNKKGKRIKATTITIVGENGRTIGLACINFYLDTPLASILANFAGPPEAEPNQPPEHFAENIEELVDKAVAGAREQVLENPSIAPSLRNKEIVGILHRDGIFQLKDAVNLVAKVLGISRNTVYLHIRNLNWL